MNVKYTSALVLGCVLIALYLFLYQFNSYMSVKNAVLLKVNTSDSTKDSKGTIFDKAVLKNIRYLRLDQEYKKIIQENVGRSVQVPPFLIDRCEARQGDFLKFAEWAESTTDKSYAYEEEPEGHSYKSASETHLILHRNSAPTTGVTFYDAYAYCQAAGGRLPTPDEWAAAAHGKEGRLYPWGNEFYNDSWVNPEPLLNAAVSCEEFPRNKTPDNISSMGAGVSEWTHQKGKSSDADQYYLSGGNAKQKPFELYSASFVKQNAQPHFRAEFAGFRCAYDTPPPEKTRWNSEVDNIQIEGGDYRLGFPGDSLTGIILPGLRKDEIGDLPMIYSRAAKPNQEVRFSKYEVSVWQFYFFLYDPLTLLGLYDHPNRPVGHDYTPLDWENQKSTPFHPVSGVDWWTAFAVAVKFGGKLPTAEEWSLAYTNNFKSFYPWGEEDEAGLSISRFWGSYSPADIDETSLDISQLGIHHLAGNISEWTRTVVLKEAGYEFILKGGNYILPFNETKHFDYKQSINPNVKDKTFGIRVVY